MGYAYQAICYATQAQALEAYFGNHGPLHVTEGSSHFNLFHYNLVSGTWVIQRTNVNKTNGSTDIAFQTVAPTPTFTACDAPNDKTTQFLDGMELGAAVASAMVLVWVIRAIRPFR